MNPPLILVTGASGFVGGALVRNLLESGRFSVLAATRTHLEPRPGLVSFAIDTLDGDTQWRGAFTSPVEVVIHCAARVHVMQASGVDSLEQFRKINVDGTLNLARHAAAAGVKRFIFISSIKVNGESTEAGHPFTPEESGPPIDPYGRSKWEAENQLRALALDSGMEVVIIRPVLVYGPGVKANFRSMMSWLSKGIPLPLGAISNSRSLVAVTNLVDLLVRCIDHPLAANQTFLVSDDEDVSTPQLLSRLSQYLGKKTVLLPIPQGVLVMVASLVGKRMAAQRLCGSLQVDIAKTRQLLEWAPVISLDAALQATASAFLEQRT